MLRLAVGTLVVAVLLAPASGPAAAPTWQAPTTLSSLARQPSLHVDAAGNVTAFMRSGAFPSWRDVAWEHAPGGQWPPTPTPLAPAGVGGAVLAVNSTGAAVAVWTNDPVLQASYRPAGGAWGPTETVANTGGPYSALRIDLDDAGNVGVAWHRNTSPSTSLVEVALRSVSSGWLPVDTMPPGPREIERSPDVAFENTGEVVLVWGSLTAIPSYTRLLAATRSLTSAWTAPVELSPPTTTAQDIAVGSNHAGTVVVTWHDVTAVRSAGRTGGGTWGPADVLASPGGTGSLAEIGRAVVDAAGNATALWSRHDGTNWRVETASRPAGGGWQLPATTLSPVVNGGAQPVLAGNGAGAAAATWQQPDGANVGIAAAVRPAGGSWPASPVLVSAAGTNAESASVVVDSTGLAAAVWIEGGFHGVAKAALSDGVGPTTTITTPADGATYEQGAVVAADYSCADDVSGQLASCAGPVPDGSAIATGSPGPGSFAVTGTDRAGNTTTVTHSYTVQAAPALAITNVTEVSNTVGRFARFEAAIELSRSFTNPFDPDVIAVDVTFTSPTGRVRVAPAFWYQPFTASGTFESYTPTGLAGWRVRFAPDEVGTHTYSVIAVAGAQAAAPVGGSFQATSTVRDGFVRVDDRNGRYLRFDSGEPYIPVGHNVAFEDGNPFLDGTGYYSSVLGSLDTAGENWTRVWMTDFNRSALEWGDGGSGHYSGFYAGAGTYSLPSAWRMDRILELAEQHGIAVQLVLNDHGQFSTWVNGRWAPRCAQSDPPPCEPGDVEYDPGNGYSAFNGGPVADATPQAFFSDPDARNLFKQRLRYLVGRYGAYTSLLAWELFNEVQFIGTNAANLFGDASLRADVVSWHNEMSSYLDGIDAYDHLVTTSSWEPTVTPGLWSLPKIDLVQIHTYAAPASSRTQELRDLVSQLKSTYGKPVLVGEVGIGSGDPESGIPPDHRGFDPATFPGSTADREHLVEGTHVHNAMWAAVLSESGAGYWWWGKYIAADTARNRGAPTFPLNERLVPPLLQYLDGEDWAPLGLDDATIGTSGQSVAVGLSAPSQAYVWVRDVLNEYGTSFRPGNLAGRLVTGESIDIPGLDDGRYRVDVYDTWGSGALTDTVYATASAGVLTVALPNFTRDVALKIVSEPAVDSDGDGLLDDWETNGIDGDGNGTVDLALQQPPYNADPQHKDVFIEVDYMAAHAPQPETLPNVVAAFDSAPVGNPDGATGIRLHALLGETVTTIAPASFFIRAPGAADDFDDLKLGGSASCDGFFGTPAERSGANCGAALDAKKLAFHYAVFGHSYSEAPTSSGIAELGGNDFMVTLGGKSPEWIAAAGSMHEAEAGTFMHELGHNLALRHGGFENLNCKPNYSSVMSYPLQIPYIDRDRNLDYSREALLALDEEFLDEGLGVGANSRSVVFGVQGGARVVPGPGELGFWNGEIDWNGDTSIDGSVQADVNWIQTRPDGQPLPGCGESPLQILEGHDDWSSLAYDFKTSPDFADGAHESARPLVAQELTSEIALETAQNFDFDGDGVPNAADHKIVFATSRSGLGDLYTVDPGDGAPTRLTTGNAIDAEPEWSPDRTKIAFTSTRHGNIEIYVMNADGSAVTRLTSNARSDTSPAWSPDGKKIAFASNRTGGNWDIYVMNAGGSAVTRLTTNGVSDTSPAWSPNGAKIAFSSARTGGGDIYSMNANGTAQTRLTTVGGLDTEPAWSGSTIAFSTNRDGNLEIYTMSGTGGAQIRRTVHPGQDVTPAWSPDGTRIAFATNRLGATNFEIYAMSADGGGQVPVTGDPGVDVFPDW